MEDKHRVNEEFQRMDQQLQGTSQILQKPENILELCNIWYHYPSRNKHASGKEVLQDVSYSFEKGKIYAVMGKSGAGKTTLLSIMGALMEPCKGEVLYMGTPVREMGLRLFRSRHVGFVFQDYNLLEYLTVLQNVEIAGRIAGTQGEPGAGELLEQVGISRELHHKDIRAISGGERQRVAIARAVGKGARLILADEPTGNLDEDTADGVMEVFKRIAHEKQGCVVLATHSKRIAMQTDCVLKLEGGEIQVVFLDEKKKHEN